MLSHRVGRLCQRPGEEVVVNPQRVKFIGLSYEDLPDNVMRSKVELEWQGQRYRGTADTECLEDQELISAAQAVCQALEAVVAGSNTSFEYLRCEAISAVGQSLAVVAVAVDSAVSHEYTVGISQIRDTPGNAAARAVLNATNRRMSALLE